MKLYAKVSQNSFSYNPAEAALQRGLDKEVQVVNRKIGTNIILLALSALSLFLIYFYVVRPILFSPYQRLFLKKCTAHHSLRRIKKFASRPNHPPWKKTTERMKKNGAKLSEEEEKHIIDYLEKTYP